jgi:hypothetical protein
VASGRGLPCVPHRCAPFQRRPPAPARGSLTLDAARAKYVRMSLRPTPLPSGKIPRRRRAPRRGGRRRRPRRARAPRAGRRAGAANLAVDALRARLRRVARSQVRPGVGRAQRRDRRDRPSRAHRDQGARRHRRRDAAGARPRRVPEPPAGVRGSPDAGHGRGDGVRASVRQAPGFIHRATFSPRTKQYFAVPRAGRPRRSTTARTCGRRPASAGHWEHVRDGARKIREKRAIPAGFGLSPSPTAT